MVHTATILINTQPMLIRMAGGEGLEPSSTDLESIFLPLENLLGSLECGEIRTPITSEYARNSALLAYSSV